MQNHSIWRAAILLNAILFCGFNLSIADESSSGEDSKVLTSIQNDSALNQAATKAAQAPTSTTAGATPSATPAGNYNPTEEISDDLSVSFPVDI